jgi:single-strand DNA-binding protein
MNKVILCGRLIKDAELQVLKNIQGTNVLKYTIAVDRDYKNKSGEKITDFINVEQIGNDLSKLYPHLVKGKQLIVEGQLNIDKVNDKYFTKIKAQRVQFVGNTATSKVEESVIEDDDTPF